jgi:hypothetical protein
MSGARTPGSVFHLQFAVKLSYVSLRAERSNSIHNKINHFEIATSLTLLAMTARIEFFRKLLEPGGLFKLTFSFNDLKSTFE